MNRRAREPLYISLTIVSSILLMVFTLWRVTFQPLPNLPASLPISLRAQQAQVATAFAGSLSAQYNFDGSSVADSTGAHNGSIVGAASYTSGKVGQGLSLTDPGAGFTTSDFIGSSAVTVCAWINFASLGANQYLIDNGKLQIVTSTNGRFVVIGDGSTAVYSATNAAATGVWQHWCFSRDASGVTNIYLNGSQSGTVNGNSGTPAAGTASLHIGFRRLNDASIRAVIDDVRIFSRVLSASEVQSVMADTGASSGGSGGGSNPGNNPPPDTQNIDTTPPSVPASLVFSGLQERQVTLSWNISTDSGGGTVAGYTIFRNGTQIAKTAVSTYTDTGLTGSTAYSYTVLAYDNAIPANSSAQSQPLALTTLAPAVVPPNTGVAPSANNITEPGEACDGADLNGLTYASVAAGFKGGTLRCRADRQGYDTSGLIPGDQVNAASCSQTDVQTAIDSAVDGNIINVPAGTCTWTTPVMIGVLPKHPLKSIVLRGAGIGQTTIIDNTASYAPRDADSALSIHVASGRPVRVTGFTFDGSHSKVSQGPVSFSGPPGNPLVRIDHSRFINLTSGGVIFNTVYGLADHLVFDKTVTGSVTAIEVNGDGNSAWNRPLSLGTANAVYMEQNTFNFATPPNGSEDTYNGARWVMRYNDIEGTWTGNHGFDSGGFRSGFSYEIYNNTYNNPGSTPITFVFESRGGTGVIYNNTITSAGKSFNGAFMLRNYRSSDYYPLAYGGTFPWNGSPANGICDGTNSNDGNSAGMQGYPCHDQIGRTTGQALDPVYGWNNNFKGSVGGNLRASGYGLASQIPVGGTDRSLTHIVQGRDFYNDVAKPGYYAYPYPHPLSLIDATTASVPVVPQNDTTPPVISSIGTSAITDVSATINWSTNEAASSKVEYGPTIAYGSNSAFNSSLVSVHSQVLNSLAANSVYHFRVRSIDAAGNEAVSADQTFTTLTADQQPDKDKPSEPLPDTTSPTKPQGLQAVAISPYQINLTWNAALDPAGKTGEATPSGVTGYKIYLNGTSYTTVSGIGYSFIGAPDTDYSFNIVAYDAAGNVSMQSDTATAHMAKLPPQAPVPLIVSNGAPWQEISADTKSVDISVETNKPATCEYSTNSSTIFGHGTRFSSTGAQKHQSSISALKKGSTYTYYVLCQDGNGTESLGNYIISFSVAKSAAFMINNPTITNPRTSIPHTPNSTNPKPGNSKPTSSVPSVAIKPFTLTLNISSWDWLFRIFAVSQKVLFSLIGL